MKRSDNLSPMENGLVEPVFRTPNVFEVQVDSGRPGLLILNERSSNDWHARVNSQSASVLLVNFTQPAVALPAGAKFRRIRI